MSKTITRESEVAKAIIGMGIDPHRIAWIFGPAYVDIRRRILTDITGKKLPKSKCGINALMAALYEVFPVSGYTCQNHREEMLGNAIVEALIN